MDEDDWSLERVDDYRMEDGSLMKIGMTDPMQAVRERRAASVARTLDALERCCRPLLVCLSGSLAYGLDTPESDVDIRGIFLNETEKCSAISARAISSCACGRTVGRRWRKRHRESRLSAAVCRILLRSLSARKTKSMTITAAV